MLLNFLIINVSNSMLPYILQYLLIKTDPSLAPLEQTYCATPKIIAATALEQNLRTLEQSCHSSSFTDDSSFIDDSSFFNQINHPFLYFSSFFTNIFSGKINSFAAHTYNFFQFKAKFRFYSFNPMPFKY